MGMRYRICNELALAVDAIGRARDALPADAPQIEVTDYSFDQIERAMDKVLEAFAMAIGSTVLTTGDYAKILARIVKFEERMQDSELFTNVVIEGDPDGKKRLALVEGYIRDLESKRASNHA